MSRKLIITDGLEARKARFPIWRTLAWVGSMLATGAVFAIIGIFVFSVFFKTEEQRALEKENKLYESLYAQMLEQESLVHDVVEELGNRDENIYREIFHTEAPAIDILGSYGLHEIPDNMKYPDLVKYEDSRISSVQTRVDSVCSNLQRILDALNSPDVSMPPMGIPIDNLTYPQVGASTGEKMNPYYKVLTQHNGVDIIGQQGNPVRATAPGTVKDVTKSKKGDGNVVVIEHAGGFVTKYAHLDDIVVKKGQRVSTGTRIGTLGVSGTTYAPHLHYEVRLNGEPVDPVGLFLAGVSATDYANMLYMASRTQQSLD